MKLGPNLMRQFDQHGQIIYIYSRKIPADLQSYMGRDGIKIALGHLPEEALIRVSHLNQQLNSIFDLLRKPNKVGHDQARALLIAYDVAFNADV